MQWDGHSRGGAVTAAARDESRAPERSLDYRPEIDGLRAVAVIAVVVFHAFPALLPGGFVGVDVFFVISGYLITGIILADLDRGRFSFAGFYVRRARRILPALLLVLIACFLAGRFLLYPDEFLALCKHILAAAGFVSNYVLLQESGYFDVEAESKILLHLWSLGVEEQFYILWPFLMWLARKRGVKPGLFLLPLFGISLVLCVYETAAHPARAYFSLPTRGWEPLLGALLAVFLQARPAPAAASNDSGKRGAGTTRRNGVAAAGLTLIAAALALIDRDKVFPGVWALVPTAGAALVIAAGPAAWGNRALLARPLLVYVGRISYPLYLWHWPLLTFAHVTSQENETPAWLRLAIVIASLFLAALTYHCIERPVRARQRIVARPARLAALALAAGIAALAISQAVKERDFMGMLMAQRNKWSAQSNAACERRYGPDYLTFCMLSAPLPRVLLFGDSHANQFYPGLAARRGDLGVLSIGNGPPLDGIQVKFGHRIGHAWEAGHWSYQKVMNIVANEHGLETVVMQAHWAPLTDGHFYLESDRKHHGEVSLREVAGEAPGDARRLLKAGLARSVSRLRSLGKNVVIAIDTPEPLIDLGYCLRIHGIECAFSKAEVLVRQASFRAEVEDLRRADPELKVFDPVPILCPGETCPAVRDGRLLYRDNSHVSEYASELLADALLKQIDAFAPAQTARRP